MTWRKTVQNCKRGAGGDYTSEKMNAEKYKNQQTFFKIFTERFSTASPDEDFRTIIK